jgi:excisionase family DNA binding protein
MNWSERRNYIAQVLDPNATVIEYPTPEQFAEDILDSIEGPFPVGLDYDDLVIYWIEENDIEPDPLNEVVTIAEAAEITGRAASTILTTIVNGNIHARKSGKTWLLRRSDVRDRWEK